MLGLVLDQHESNSPVKEENVLLGGKCLPLKKVCCAEEKYIAMEQKMSCHAEYVLPLTDDNIWT